MEFDEQPIKMLTCPCVGRVEVSHSKSIKRIRRHSIVGNAFPFCLSTNVEKVPLIVSAVDAVSPIRTPGDN